MDEFKPSAGFVERVMRRIAESGERTGPWRGRLHYKVLRLAVAASALLGSALVAIPCR